MSQQLATLERETSAILLVKSGRRLQFTPQGELLVQHAAAILDALDSAPAEVAGSSAAVTGAVRIAVFQSAALTILPTAATTFARDYPALRVEVAEREPEQGLFGYQHETSTSLSPSNTQETLGRYAPTSTGPSSPQTNPPGHLARVERPRPRNLSQRRGLPAENDDALCTPAERWGVAIRHERILLCGSGARRGGAINGLGGHNAVMAVLEPSRFESNTQIFPCYYRAAVVSLWMKRGQLTMMPQPTGRLERKDDGVYVVLDRIFKAPIEEVWTYFSRSSRLALWIGQYTGTGSTGAVKFRMNAEGDDTAWQNVAVMVCDAPHRLHVDVGEAPDSRVMFVHLTEASGHTTVTFGQRLHAIASSAVYGVGWDYYLDRLVAAHNGKTLPAWDDYYPTMEEYYQTLCQQLDHDLRIAHSSAQRNGTTG